MDSSVHEGLSLLIQEEIPILFSRFSLLQMGYFYIFSSRELMCNSQYK